MTNYATGHDAEKVAADYMKQYGYKILAINWHTKYCEIDIIAQKDKTIFFTEVKYRKTNSFGTGLDYITPKKLRQMEFAAEMWVSENNWKSDYQLAALEMSGPSFEVTNFLTNI